VISERPARIAICDDEPAARRGVVRALTPLGHTVLEVPDGEACLALLDRERLDLVILDLGLPGLSGRATLRRIVARSDPPPVVVLTADSAVETALAVVEEGAADYLAKPYELGALRFVVERTLRLARLRLRVASLEAELASSRGAADATPVARSPAMAATLERLEAAALSEAPVLLLGETGTGKEVAARHLHRASPRRDGPFVAVNCAALPPGLAESELFGHRRGAFTGADRDRPGRFAAAAGGTLFLDEVGDMPPELQAKLLRAIERGAVTAVGDDRERSVSVRVVAATHRPLREMVESGRFRADLFYRLAVVTVEIPPLRHRREDILPLARELLRRSSPRPVRLSPAAERALLEHPWPGNVRELRNVLEHAAIFCRGGVILPEDLPLALPGTRGTAPAGSGPGAPALREGETLAEARRRVLDELERRAIAEALAATGGNVTAAARRLGLHRQSLQRLLRRYGRPPREG